MSSRFLSRLIVLRRQRYERTGLSLQPVIRFDEAALQAFTEKQALGGVQLQKEVPAAFRTATDHHDAPPPVGDRLHAS